MNAANRKLDYIVFMLRGSGLHIGHFNIIEYGLTIAHKVIIFFGSDNRPRTIKDPFTCEERIEMLARVYRDQPEIWSRLIVSTLGDHARNEDFVIAAQNKVDRLICIDGGIISESTVGITGYTKDTSSFYLNIFPEWEFFPAPYTPPVDGFVLDATNVRNVLFSDTNTLSEIVDILIDIVPTPVLQYFIEWSKTDAYRYIMQYRHDVKIFKEKLVNYPNNYVATDAMLVCGDYILLITRGKIGKGLLALPGGFLEVNLRIEENLYKELDEEAMIEVPVSELKKAFLGYHVEDTVNRSERCRIMTHMGVFNLESIGYSNTNRPKVTGGDDASHADWYLMDDLKTEDFFEDHKFLVERGLAKFF